ncbi:uncharacterized protein IUM83_04632 [Phytophthora cinnamomi]|uniref:uncharacterized protein n=1 Tax=Phytophthora cinnamomi TaxID=4785 RepID=UPI003559BF8E|nr:hypothetical protein IUM83_04632 [Phytophthora cinnamomi]
MSWQDGTSEEDGYEWICSFLSGYDGDLVEFELDEDGQHFFDNMSPLLAQLTSYHGDGCRSHLQITPFVLSVVSEQRGTLSGAGTPPSCSHCVKMEEDQSALDVVVLRSRSFRRAVTTPRIRSRSRRHSDFAVTQDEAYIQRGEKASTSSRQQINRRLF